MASATQMLRFPVSLTLVMTSSIPRCGGAGTQLTSVQPQHDAVVRLANSQRYQLTSLGRRVAVLFTKAHSRVLAPGFALLDPLLPPEIAAGSPLGLVWRHLDQVLDDFVDGQLIAA
jgi:hypothetical protein